MWFLHHEGMGPEGSLHQRIAYIFRGRISSLSPLFSKASSLEEQRMLLSRGSNPRPGDLCQSKNAGEPRLPGGTRFWGGDNCFTESRFQWELNLLTRVINKLFLSPPVLGNHLAKRCISLIHKEVFL